MTTDPAVDANTSKCPFDLHCEELDAFIKLEKDVKGQIMIRGVDGVEKDKEDEDDDDEENEIDKSTVTAEQVQACRHVLITKNREKQLNSMRRLVLGEQANDRCLMFNTSFSNEVLRTWHFVKRSLASTKDPSKKLDRLFAYSYNLFEFDVWIHDNEGDMGELVKGLGRAWKSLMKKYSDEELGWDRKYTKLGTLEFLKQFKSKIDSMPDYYKLGKFNFE